jgi:hypothetical protein
MAKIAEIKDEKNNRWIWIDPWFVEVLCKYLHETMENNGLSNYNTELLNLYESFKWVAHGKSALGIDGAGIYFEPEIMENVKNVTTVVNILNQTKTNIASLGAEITTTMLNQHEADKFYDWQIISWSRPIKTSSLVNLIGIVIYMLDISKPFDLNNYVISFEGWEDIGGIGPRYV